MLKDRYLNTTCTQILNDRHLHARYSKTGISTPQTERPVSQYEPHTQVSTPDTQRANFCRRRKRPCLVVLWAAQNQCVRRAHACVGFGSSTRTYVSLRRATIDRGAQSSESRRDISCELGANRVYRIHKNQHDTRQPMFCRPDTHTTILLVLQLFMPCCRRVGRQAPNVRSRPWPWDGWMRNHNFCRAGARRGEEARVGVSTGR